MVHWNECFIYEVKIIARNRGRDSASPLGAYTHSGHGEEMEERVAEKNEWMLSVHTYVSERTKMGESELLIETVAVVASPTDGPIYKTNFKVCLQTLL